MLYAHDAKNHLAAIRELNEDPRIDAYVDKLSDQFKSYSSNCHSGNKLLDLMLNKYILECEGCTFARTIRNFALGIAFSTILLYSYSG